MTARPDESFFDDFSLAVRQAMADKLRVTYDEVADRHDVAVGFNQNTFSIGIYHVAAHQIATLEQQLGGRLRVLTRSPKYRVRVGEFTMACHRVGSSMGDDIMQCFPRPGSAATEMVPQVDPSQLRFAFPDVDPAIGLQRSIVLAHFGNPIEGFLKAYLCFPTKQIDGQIVEWGFADPLLHDMADSLSGPRSSDTHLPPEEVIEDYALELTEKAERDAGS